MPRVAVHQADGTVFAYKVGNVIDGSHNVDLLSGTVTPVEHVLAGLVAQAKAEYPEHEVQVEHLVDGTWVAESTPDEAQV
jgi:hypothetical protein